MFISIDKYFLKKLKWSDYRLQIFKKTNHMTDPQKWNQCVVIAP